MIGFTVVKVFGVLDVPTVWDPKRGREVQRFSQKKKMDEAFHLMAVKMMPFKYTSGG